VNPTQHIRRWQDQLAAWRRDFHAHPETGFEEHRTAALVAERLASWGIEVHRGVGGATGVIGTLRNGRGNRAVGLRADMDALPMDEENAFAHRSTAPGKMHACGHDGHTTMLLGAARYLAETRRFDGTGPLHLPAAEEGGGGARAMVADGLFRRFPCDAVYGLHNRPGMAVGRYGIRPGAMMAGCAFFDIHVHGKGGHGARPENTVDPVVCGAQIVSPAKRGGAQRPSAEAAVVSVTGFDAGRPTTSSRSAWRCAARCAPSTPKRCAWSRRGCARWPRASRPASAPTAALDFREVTSPGVNAAEQTAIFADGRRFAGGRDGRRGDPAA
jgi:hippurate hydrolase